MKKKESSPEEQRLKVRRRLLKLGAYTVPIIITVLAAEEAYAPPLLTDQAGHLKKGGSVS